MSRRARLRSHVSGDQNSKQARRPRWRPSLEVVENRILLSTVIENLTAGVLTVTGSDDADTISVHTEGTDVVVDYVTRRNNVQIDSGTFREKADQVQNVIIDGSQGDDSLDVSAYAGPVTLKGGGGDDTLTVGTGDATVDGGPGTNTLHASGAVDLTLTDASLTGLGHDTLASIQKAALTIIGSDPHTLDATGFSGVLTLSGGSGGDTLKGGTGAGTFDGGPGDDQIILLNPSQKVGGALDVVKPVAGNDTVHIISTGPGGTVTADYTISNSYTFKSDNHTVITSFLNTWVSNGGESSFFGVPVDSAQPGTGGVMSQRFAGGLMYSSANTGLLTVPYDLPQAALPLFHAAYGPVRHTLLSDFFYNGFVAQRVYSQDGHGVIKFSDQTKDMGHTLMSFAQEATILQHAGFDPTAAENVVRIILNAFDQLLTDGVSELYGPQSVTRGLFVRDFVANGDEGDPHRQGIPIKQFPNVDGAIQSDFQDSGPANGNSTNGDAVMSADQITFMMDGWWAVVHYSTNAASVAKAQSQASAVIDYMINHRYEIRSVGAATVDPGRGDARLPAAFLSHLADAVTGDNSFYRLDNTISIGTINKQTLVEGIVNVVDATLAAATAGLSEGYKALFHDDPGRDVANALTARLPSEIPVELPVSVENGILLAILKLNPFYITSLGEIIATQSISLNEFIPSPIRDILQGIVFTVPTGFSSGSQKVVWEGIHSHIEITPPSITTKDISLLGLLGEIKFPIGSILGSVKIPSFALDLGLNQLAFDPNFSSGQFQDLALADMNQSIPGDQPDEWEALLRAEVQGYSPTPEVKAAAESDAASAPVTGMGTGASGHWDSKDRWETAAQNDDLGRAHPEMKYNGADFLTLDTLIQSRGLASSLAASQPAAVLVPNPIDPSKTDLQVHGSSGPDTIVLVHHDGGAVEVVMNNSSLGTFNPTADVHVQAGGGDDQITIQGDLGHPTFVIGEDGNDTIILANGAGPGVTIDGGSGSNTLVGDNVATTWMIKGPGSGSLSVGTTFSNIQNLIGGTAADIFVFAGGGSVSGNIDGKGGGDALDFSFAPPQAVILSAAGSVDGYNGTASGSQILGGSFSNVSKIVGSVSQSTSTLTGLDNDATWTVVAPPSQLFTDPNPSDPSSNDLLAATSQYVRSSDGRSLSFGNFGTLNGGSGRDTFNIRSTGSALNANGNAGNDAFVVSSSAGIDGFGQLGDIGGTLTIDAGSGDTNQLTVINFNSLGNPNVTFTSSSITGFAPSPIRYSATGGHFSGTDGIHLVGSNLGADVFNIQSTLAGSQTRIDALGGDDTFDLSSDAPTNHGNLDGLLGPLTLDGGLGMYADGTAGSNTRGLISHDRLVASGDADYVLADTITTFKDGTPIPDRTASESRLSVVSYGAGVSVAIPDIRLVSIEAADLTGGPSANRMDASGFSGSVVLNGMGGNDTLIGGSGDNVLDGGDGDDILFAGDDRFARPGLGSQANVLLGGGGTNLLRGGPGRDTFHADLSGTATLDGGDDDDTFIITNSAGLVTSPVGGITIIGGGQPGDILRLVGGGGATYNQLYMLGASAGEGRIVTTNNHNPTGPTISQYVRFTGLAAIDDSVTANQLSVMGASASAPVGGASAADLAAGRMRLTVGGIPFAAITFSNKTKPSVLMAGGQVVTAAAPVVAGPVVSPLAITVSTPVVAGPVASPLATTVSTPVVAPVPSATASTVASTNSAPSVQAVAAPAAAVSVLPASGRTAVFGSASRRFGLGRRVAGHPGVHPQKNTTLAGHRAAASHFPRGPLGHKIASSGIRPAALRSPK